MRRKKLVPGRLYELSWEDYVFYKDHSGWHWNRALTLGAISPSAKLFFVEVVEIEHEGVRWRLAKCLYNEQYYHFGSWDYERDRFDLPELIPVEKCHDD
ncbi:MAG: hypothetical protein E6R04_01370 [Spirochaetes bacterium]|nr:MAG: hypothetical protein E6R04_01370 [Spirochaetota bacterium]